MIVCFLHTKLSCTGEKLTELEWTKVGVCQDSKKSENVKGVCMQGCAHADLPWNLNETGRDGHMTGVRDIKTVRRIREL